MARKKSAAKDNGKSGGTKGLKETISLTLAGDELLVTVTRRPRQKYIRLRVSGRGEVVVSAPKHTSQREIRRALAGKQDWIAGHLRRVREDLQVLDPLSGIFYIGRRYSVQLREGTGTHFSVRLSAREERIVVRMPPPFSKRTSRERERRIEAALAAWLRRRASQVLRALAQEISEEIDLPFKRLYIRDQRTRWGSSSSLGNISLNWRTVMAPPAVQRYLIIHELAHQRHLNHSQNFWRAVQRYCPDFKQHEAWLKRHRGLMALFR